MVPRRAFGIGACVVGLLCASACSSGAGQSAAATTTTGATNVVTSTTVASATVAQLAAGHWLTIPAAPLSNRLFTSVAWTGKELIVWGGNDSPSGQPRNDGAAYNPTTRAWRKLASSPLTSRGGAAAVWTGSEVVFWGGVVPAPAGRVTPGSIATAAYRPDTNSWRTIAAAPLPPTTFPIGLWTGDRVVLFSGPDAASYDPSTNTWQRLPSPVLPPHLPGWQVQRGWELAVSAGPGRILAWSGWGAQKQTGPNSSEGSAGSDLFRYDESTNRWTALGPTAAAISGPGEGFWTGSRVLVLASVARAPLDQGPPEPLMTASYDFETGKATVMPAGALVANGLQVWTGAALWSDRGAGYGPGDTATAFDPASSTSRRLAGAPFTSNYPAKPIWTGISVLIYASAQVEPPQPHPVGGLEYIIG